MPSITNIIVIPEFLALEKFNSFLNDNQITHTNVLSNYEDLPSGHALLFDLKLDQRINESFANKPKLYEAVLVIFGFQFIDWYCTFNL